VLAHRRNIFLLVDIYHITNLHYLIKIICLLRDGFG